MLEGREVFWESGKVPGPGNVIGLLGSTKDWLEFSEPEFRMILVIMARWFSTTTLKKKYVMNDNLGKKDYTKLK